jgi:hypothetical protein
LLLLDCSAFDSQQGVKADSVVKRPMLAFDTVRAERRRRVAARDCLVTLPQRLVKHEQRRDRVDEQPEAERDEIRFWSFPLP